jgi:serine/threonine-protein kinase HipA
MSSDEQLIVMLDAPELGSVRPVGVLTRYGGPRPTVAFAYARSWLESKDSFELEPRLRLVEGPQYSPSGDLPSILGDTTPDLWGKLLLERREALAAKQEGRRARRLSGWEFLVGVADETRMGALRLRRGLQGPFVDNRDPAIPPMTGLRALEDAARAFEKRHGEPIADATIALLITPGSSLGGARPKANFRGVEGDVWIAKFPSKTDRRDSGAWEEVYAQIARAAGIEVADTSLLRLGTHGQTFATRRFDRTQAGRRLFASAMTITGKEDGEPASYPDLAKAVTDVVAATAVRKDLEQLFRRLVFNVLAGNRDDHLRNHGFLRYSEGWRLAPAFDMNPAREMREHSLAIDGATTEPSLPAAMETHGLYGLSEERAREIVRQVGAAVSRWTSVADSVGISKTEQETVGTVLQQLPSALAD